MDYLKIRWSGLLIALILGSCGWSQTNSATVVAILGVYDSNCAGCQEDFNQDGEVNSADLVWALNNYATIPIDIVPRWYTLYNDQPGGQTSIPVYCTLPGSELTWEELEPLCHVSWIKDGQVVATGSNIMLEDISNICDGSFPLTMRIRYEYTVFERTGIMKVGTVWTDDDPVCDYGYTIFDADQSSYEMNPFFYP